MQKIWQQNEEQTQNDAKRGQTLAGWVISRIIISYFGVSDHL